MKRIANFLFLFVIIFLIIYGLLIPSYNTFYGSELDQIVPDEQYVIQNYNPQPIDLKSLIETQSSNIGNLTISKQIVSNVWHVGCNVMGNQAWVKDQISNPQGIKSKEGHRLAYCGDPSHWIIYLNERGIPYHMDQIKSGATGGTLNTKFFTDGTYTQQMNIRDIKIGERIYWITWHNDQVWHHTGITTLEVPEFTFIFNNQEYKVKAGQSVTINQIPVGTYQIIEKFDPNFFIGDVNLPFKVNQVSDVIVTVQINDNQMIEVNFINKRIVPDQPETQLITQIQTQTQTETQTQTQLIIIQTKIETESQTELITQIAETQKPTEATTKKITQITTEKHTEPQTQPPKETESIKQKQITKQTELPKQTQPKKVIQLQIQNLLPPTIETEPPLKNLTNSFVLGANRDKETERQERKVKGKYRYQSITEQGQIINLDPRPPKTGDNSQVDLLVQLYILSALAILVIITFIINTKK